MQMKQYSYQKRLIVYSIQFQFQHSFGTAAVNEYEISQYQYQELITRSYE